MNLNKKGYSNKLFGFFFVLVIFSALFFFMTFVMHYLLYDLGMAPVQVVTDNIFGVNSTTSLEVSTLSTGFLNMISYYDILFLLFIVGLFIESTIFAVKARESGYFSFFGYATIGNIFLIWLLSYSVQIQGWFMNEIVYAILLVSPNAPTFTTFMNYGIYICITWYLWLLIINQIDFAGLKEKVKAKFGGSRTAEKGAFEE